MNHPEGKKTSLLKEPLLHFLLIGAALFLFQAWRDAAVPRSAAPGGQWSTRIVVTQEDIQRMNALFAKTWQRPPDAAEQQALIEDFIRNEIFYREALAIGLDRDDEVLKRRLRQKMEFIHEDIGALAEPTDADLTAFMQAHREKYLADPQVAFRQVYVSQYKRGEKAAADAREILDRLLAGADPAEAGDETQLASMVTRSPLQDIRARFGDDFAQALPAIAPGRWAGPIRSGYGLHLVYVQERIDARLPELDAIRNLVKQDWLADQQKQIKDKAYAMLRKRYAVTVEKPAVSAAQPALSENVAVAR